MHLDIKIALVGVFGVLFGAGLTAVANYYFNLEAGRQELLRETRREAYVEWLNVRELAGQSDYDLKGRQSINQIAIYGSQDVVNLIATWYRTDPRLKFCDDRDPNFNSGQHQAEVNAFQAMRRDLITDKAVSNSNMSVLIKRCEWPRVN